MFERFTERARRVIFFARYEASQYGSPAIESEHLLLGLMREDKGLLNWGPLMRPEIEAQIKIRERISTSVEMPLSDQCERILSFTAEEADRMGSKHVSTAHILLGILREDKSLAALVLAKHGATLSELRERFSTQLPVDSDVGQAKSGFVTLPHPSSQARFGTMLDQFLEAWRAHDSKKLDSFFALHGQFWDIHGELWVSPGQIEKGLAEHFANVEPTESALDIRDVKFASAEIGVVTLVWKPQAGSKARTIALRMVLVLRDAHPGWHVVSAHLALLQPGPHREKR